MKKAVIVQRILTDYRVPFFNGLREKLKEGGIDLDLIHGRGNAIDNQRGYLAHLDWAKVIPEKYFQVGKYQLVYQPYYKHIKNADIIVLAQEMKYLLNYYLLMSRSRRRSKVALWGHVRNYKEDSNSLMNRLKKKLNGLPDWWFTYTQEEASIIAQNGFKKENISIVQNTINAESLLAERKQVSDEQLLKTRLSFEINEEDPVGLFCGGMYTEKRMKFIINSCKRIKADLPNFHMIFIGAGPDAHYVEKFAEENNWVHFLGPVFDEKKKSLLFLISDVLLSPGLVGLGIIDSFVLECPMITTSYPFHSPEIQYLEDGRNGLISLDDETDYVNMVIKILSDKDRLIHLKEGCRQSTQIYSMENMITNFTNGITQCLNHEGVAVA